MTSESLGLFDVLLVKKGADHKRHGYLKGQYRFETPPHGWRLATKEEFGESAVNQINAISENLHQYGITPDQFDKIVTEYAQRHNIKIDQEKEEKEEPKSENTPETPEVKKTKRSRGRAKKQTQEQE